MADLVILLMNIGCLRNNSISLITLNPVCSLSALMDSPSVATVATSLAAEATEAGTAEAAVVEGLRSVVAAVVEGLRSVVAAVVEGLTSVVAAVVESLGDGGSLAETLASSEGNSLRGGSARGKSSSELALLTDKLTLLETDNGCLAGTTWDGLAAAESLDRSVRSAGGIKAGRDELTTEVGESVTS